MKIYFYILILTFCISCNILTKEYKVLNVNEHKGSFYHEKLKVIKPILKKESDSTTMVVSWDKNMLSKGPTKIIVLIYNCKTKEKKIVKSSKTNELETIKLEYLNDRSYKEFLYILDNYLDGKEQYLLSIENSFSNSEMNSPYYIYDFIKRKKVKINSFILDDKGNVIQ